MITEHDINSFIQFVILFPSDAFYIVDCKRVAKYKLSNNFEKMIDDDGDQYSSKNIGEILSISKHTADTHRRNIIQKLELNGSVKAYNRALDIEIISY